MADSPQDQAVRTHSPLMDGYVRAHAQRGPRQYPHRVKLLVVHDMESPEDWNRAENLGKHWFGTSESGKANTHYGVDNRKIFGYVRETHTCYGASGGTNSTAIHVEHAGYAKQSAAEWQDAYSVRMLDRSARLFADLCKFYNIPVQWVDADAIRHPEATGITSHREITFGRGPKGGHTDPGEHFPIKGFMSLVEGYMDGQAMPILGIGDKDVYKSNPGEFVAIMQRCLVAHGLDIGNTGPSGKGDDGEFGQLGDKALKAFQSAKGITDHGLTTRDTWDALLADPPKLRIPPKKVEAIPGRKPKPEPKQVVAATDILRPNTLLDTRLANLESYANNLHKEIQRLREDLRRQQGDNPQ